MTSSKGSNISNTRPLVELDVPKLLALTQGSNIWLTIANKAQTDAPQIRELTQNYNVSISNACQVKDLDILIESSDSIHAFFA